MARVCVVDDKELMRDSLAAMLVREDHEVEVFADAREALEAARRRRYDVVVTDLKMPGLDGIGLLGALRSGGLETPVIVMTAYGTVGTAVEAMKLGAFDYIQKPFEADEMAVLVERAIQHGRLRAEHEALQAAVRDWEAGRRLVGQSEGLQEVRRQIERVASSSATVLIEGESGTGKELVARAIHAASPRADRPMLCVNCAALSSTLLESELFGHDKGAFTGADRLRKGRFELADGGTLLLDEISEVPLALQGKLLRVLQEQEFERVGSSLTRRVDVRVIATTNRVLRDWVAAGRFRQDLYFRTSVLPIRIPPLAQRREDVAELTDYFLARIGRREGRQPLRVSAEAMRLLAGYDWPGNVRELENICERASVLVSGQTIEAATLEPWLSNGATGEDGKRRLREGRLLEDMERELIAETLSRFRGHRERTAKALGIGVRTLGMKLKRWREQGCEVVGAQGLRV
jgi:DNA-binding NtrC family response regulator